MAKIILFGGSFDPIHNGHLNMAAKALSFLNADKVIFILAKNPRWKNPQESTNDRLTMVNLAIEDNPNYQLSTYEIDHDVFFTIDTARYYQSLYPGDELYFLIGDDQVEKLHDWKDIDELAKIVHLVAYGRETVDQQINSRNRQNYRVRAIEGEKVHTSSTAIRDLKSIDTPKVILSYILKNKLYFAKTIKDYMKKARYIHSCSVALLAYDIAEANKLNKKHAFIAGLCHDLAKDLDKEQERALMEIYFKDYLDLPKFAYHQFIGGKFVKEELAIVEPEIIEAVSFHATGKSDMSPLGMIIYASDKIEPTRSFDSQELIEGCLKDYYHGFVAVLAANREFLLAKNKDIANRLTAACMNQYLK